MPERVLLTIEQVAVTCRVSCQTINNWYKFKRENPDNEYARMLPDFIVLGGHNQRFWDKSDLNALVNFKQISPKGCKGVMGSVTQRYVKKGQ